MTDIASVLSGESPGCIVCGDALAVLRNLPDECVHCCATSPPYWALRDYKTEPRIWGGAAECEHQWGDELPATKPDRAHAGLSAAATRADGHPRNLNRQENGQVTRSGPAGSFCQLCGAWRGSLGLEPTPGLYVQHLVEIFREVRRVLRGDACCWINLGDSYTSGNRKDRDPGAAKNLGPFVDWDAGRTRTPSGLKPKDLILIPFLVAHALRADGWYLRSMVPWVKRSAMPESCRDRPNSALEYVILLAKTDRYFWDMESVKKVLADSSVGRLEQNIAGQTGSFRAAGGNKTNGPMKAVGDSSGRNWRNADLWFESIEAPHGMVFCDDELVGFDVNPAGYKGAHFATFPQKFVASMVKSSSSEKGVCPECGAPWTRMIDKNRRATRPARNNVLDPTGMANRDPGRHVTDTTTIGWRPACKCGLEDTVPAIVLDPFMGAGTVGLIAQNLGRRWIGIELNPAYIEQALERIHGPLFAGKEKI